MVLIDTDEALFGVVTASSCPVVIGRDPAVPLPVAPSQVTVSASHAEIHFRHGEGFRILCLSRTNRTCVRTPGSQTMMVLDTQTESSLLSPGAEIVLGKFQLRVAYVGPSERMPALPPPPQALQQEAPPAPPTLRPPPGAAVVASHSPERGVDPAYQTRLGAVAGIMESLMMLQSPPPVGATKHKTEIKALYQACVDLVAISRQRLSLSEERAHLFQEALANAKELAQVGSRNPLHKTRRHEAHERHKNIMTRIRSEMS